MFQVKEHTADEMRRFVAAKEGIEFPDELALVTITLILLIVMSDYIIWVQWTIKINMCLFLYTNFERVSFNQEVYWMMLLWFVWKIKCVLVCTVIYLHASKNVKLIWFSKYHSSITRYKISLNTIRSLCWVWDFACF